MPAPELDAYCQIDNDGELRQGEIISDLTYYGIVPDESDTSKVITTESRLSYAIIATPDCDLLNDYKKKPNQQGRLLNVLFFAMEEAQSARKRLEFNSAEWRFASKNAVDGVYYLDGIEAKFDLIAMGIPPSLIDFKRYFTLPTSEIFRQCRSPDHSRRASRRCRLNDMWREDFQRRAMGFMQRVGLPDPADAR